ncbi:MAG: photosynthetic reaction center cytochrome c subunit [Roseiflexaceae bacterium]|nr:photosynthetic reaction center cytochrome c subunit [Roseiflexaceae bacterium]
MTSRQRSFDPRTNKVAAGRLAFVLVSLVLAGGSFLLIAWIVWQLLGQQEPPQITTGYVNYNIAGEWQSSDSFAQANAAYAEYVKQYPEPQNVQILTGMSTAQIYGYMVNQFSGALGVSCQHCHNLAQGNFADESNPNKHVARQMLLMTSDLNKNWINQLPASVGGYQAGCATCHNGLPVNLNGGNSGELSNYPADQAPVPDKFQIKLDSAADIEMLQVTGNLDADLFDVQYNQYVMTHMNYSLGVGCAFCHNAAYFPSNEVPQKGHALIMLKMIQHLYNGQVDPQFQYSDPNYTRGPGYLAAMNNKVPSCWMCHREAQIPPGAMLDGALPPQISSQQ